MKKVFTFLMVSILALLPVLAGASGYTSAGDYTLTAISDSMEAGNQVRFHIDLSSHLTEDELKAKDAALANLISSISVDGTAYQVDTSIYVTADINLADVPLFSLNAVSPDGALYVSTSLTDDMVFIIPAEFLASGFSIENILYGGLGFLAIEEEEGQNYWALPASDRLRISGTNLFSVCLETLLGWVSMNQIDTEGEFYWDDYETVEATETRDEVTQRLMGKVDADQFCALFWNTATILDAQCGVFQQDLSDVLEERGITRLQVHRVVDAMFPDIMIDPATDFVEPTHAIKDETALCTPNDVSYFFKKLVKYTDKLWEEGTDEVLTMVVSYNDYGETVGFDAVLPKFTESLPYEGSLSYTSKMDDDWQVTSGAHGELQISETDRVIGDYRHLNGEDVDGYNGNTFDGYLVIRNQETEEQNGFGINGAWSYTTGAANGYNTETTEGNGFLSLYTGKDTVVVLTAEMEALMRTTGSEFSIHSNGTLAIPDMLAVDYTLDMTQEEEVQEFALPEGEEIEILRLNEETVNIIKNKVQTNGVAVLLKVLGNESVQENLKVLTR